MSKFTKFLILLVILCTIDATFTTLSANKRKPNKFSVIDYINTYKNIAVKEMNRTRIPASITLAQGILESKYGNSYLARNANNHFGIKCHRSWSGKAIYADDDEEMECFRKYAAGGVSYRDHSNFLKNNGRYSFLFRYKSSDYRSWATGLGKAGYATNSKYGSHLIRIIERYQLHTFDRSKAQLKQDRVDQMMREYQLRLRGMMNEEDLYPTWFINDRPSKPSLLSSIKRRTPMGSSTYGWSSGKTAKPKEAAKPKAIAKAKPIPAKPKPIAKKKVAKPVVAKKKTPVVAAKKAAPKPVAKKPVAPAKKAIAVAANTKKSVPSKPKATPKPKPVVVAKPKAQKSIAAAPKSKPAAKVAKKDSKPKGELFSALNNWKKKDITKTDKKVSKKETAKPATKGRATHIVKKGETLYGLARRYNTQVESIKKTNNLSSDALKLGSKLVIRP
ncbi:MAG: glucosaminidase domain-containing protein [Chitinophagales bacterium]